MANCAWCGDWIAMPWATGFVSPSEVGVACSACGIDGAAALGFSPAVFAETGLFPQAWLTFQRGPPAGRAERLAAWLAAFPPSAVPADQVSWLSVAGAASAESHEGGDVARLVHSWEALPPAQRDADTALALATSVGITSGKWLFFCSPARLDDTWAALATTAVAAGLAAKAMPVGGGAAGSGYVPVMVYAQRYADEDPTGQDGMPGPAGVALRSALEPLFPKASARLKPDAFTYLNLNAGNPYKIKTSVATLSWGPK
jgi:hypothetical protein